MNVLFSTTIFQKLNETDILQWAMYSPIQSLHCYSFIDDLMEREIREMEIGVLYFIKFILDSNLFTIPSAVSNGTIYRACHLSVVDRENGYFPLLKSTVSNCNRRVTPSHPNEPTWFSFVPLKNYLGLNQNKKIGIVSCRKIVDVYPQNKCGIKS